MPATRPGYRITWRPKARDDLLAIVRYIGRDNPARAQSFGQELREKTKRLALYPELGRSGRPGLPRQVRELVAHGNYIVFCRVLARVRTIEILRIKHAAQKFP
ncbi:MAG: type II toxin-antitoxin system RelE/ParE family toxin [Alphaproteobacteria bacterium]|nr:type II toxin-antitoxin system RelE/ParE family toxin [Alphaproteobacteria bacterium]